MTSLHQRRGQPGPQLHAGKQGDPRQRRRRHPREQGPLPRHSGRRPGGRDRLPSDSDADGVPDGGGPLRQHGARRGGGRDRLHPGLGQRQHPRRARPLPGHRVGRPGGPERLPTRQRWRRHSRRARPLLRDSQGRHGGCARLSGDEDGDGVLDGLDRCPRTPTGTSINATGCPTTPGAAPQPAPRRAAPPAAPRTRGSGHPERRRPVRRRQQRHPATDQPAERRKGVSRPVSFPTSPSPPARPGCSRSRTCHWTRSPRSLKRIRRQDRSRRSHRQHRRAVGGRAPDQSPGEAVRTYLVTRGVSFQQVQARGYGRAFPLTTDNTPRGRAANRRVEIKLGL